ncbi:MAG: acyl-CoA dehydrogenase family protein [Rhizobiaceae bacterium]
MDFRLNDDQRMLGETLARFLSDNYPLDKRHEFARSDEGFSRQIWSQFAELGVIGALFGEADGGYGGTGVDLMVVFEALGRTLVVEPFLPTLLAGSLLAEMAGAEHQGLLGDVIEGKSLLALAHGEMAARYDLDHVAVTASQANGKWQVTGQKSVVLGGGSADRVLVSARTSGSPGSQDGISLFLVDPAATGVTRRAYGTVDGYPAAEISFEVAPAKLVGNPGKAYAAIEKAHARAIVAICSECLGAMEVAKDLTIEYMHTRKQFGVIIGKFQALQHRMADVLIEIEQLRSAIINAAGHLESDRRIREWHVSAAKNLAGRAGRQTAEEAIQIHGGMGMTWEYPVGHFAKRITMIDHMFGDTDHHLERFIDMGEQA